MSCRGATPAKAQVNRPPTSTDRKSNSGWTFSKSTRPAFNDNLVLYVTRRLTERDRTILDMLADHRVLTSDQLTDAFDSATTARHRLTKLHQLPVVQRFAPFVSKGSAPYHYVLDRLGAEVVAAERGVEAKKLWKQDRLLVLARTATLQRIVGINGVFTALLHEARCSDARELSLWWSAARCGVVRRPREAGRLRHLEGGRDRSGLLRGVGPRRAAGGMGREIGRPHMT